MSSYVSQISADDREGDRINRKILDADTYVTKKAERQGADTLLVEDIPPEYMPVDLDTAGMAKLQEKAWAKLGTLVGLGEIKGKLRGIVELNARSAGRNRVPGHYAFVGNPGTGKTEVARIMADILYSYGLLRTSKTVELKAGDIVGQFVGHSAPLAEAKFKEALDGVMFIDEAYSLINMRDGGFSSSFAKETYETIMKLMEDYRERSCVIFAGYKDQMKQFIEANPGMISRIKEGNIIEFRDFSDDELIRIMELMAKKSEDFHVVLTDEFKSAVRESIPLMRASRNFGNAREMRNLLEDCKEAAIKRIPKSKRVILDDGVEELVFNADDIPKRYR